MEIAIDQKFNRDALVSQFKIKIAPERKKSLGLFDQFKLML